MLSPFTWYANYFSTVNNEGGVGFFVTVTNGRTDRRTYTFFKSPRHTDSNGIQHSVVA